jgi:hypothetical protein
VFIRLQSAFAGMLDHADQHLARLSRVTVVMHDDQTLDGEGVGNAQMARQ